MAKAKRSDRIVFHVTETAGEKSYEAIGKDNDELTREMNNEVESKENVLGETSTEITKAPQVTTVDPIYYRDDSKLAKKLHDIEWNDLDGDDLEEEFMEVDKTQETSGEYAAFLQKGKIDLKSVGGDTKGLAYPFDINWVGKKTYGTFNPETKTFTPTVNA